MEQAVVLAAGEGKRLRPFTVSKPKVMLSIAGRPILSYVIESLTRNGLRNIVLVVGYQKEQVFDYFGSGEAFGCNLTYVHQERQVGTAHALSQAKSSLEHEFLVVPGDNLIEADTIARFVRSRPPSVLVKKAETPSRYGVITLENNLVREIAEKPNEAKSNIVSTGIYAFNSEVFGFIDGAVDIPDVINAMIGQGFPIRVLETEGTWLDVVYPWDLLSVNDSVLRNIPERLGGRVEQGVIIRPPVVVGRNTVIRPNTYIAGPVIIGENCEIGPHVSIMPATSIGDNVVVQPFSQVANSVIAHDVNIGPGCIIEDSVIDKGCIIKGRFTAVSGPAEVAVDDEHHHVSVGAMLGEDCIIGAGVVAQPGTVLGNLCQIQSLKVVSGRLPDKSLVL